ncbi:hypothetical protein EDB19DRAFT_1943250 [Suillus lakei]|nr:hypothetical protein EDB19DRAFT_1943250 [Suillus lakei]
MQQFEDVVSRRMAIDREQTTLLAELNKVKGQIHNFEEARQGIQSALQLSRPARLPHMKGPLPSVIALHATSSDIELLLLRSIVWTMFEDGTHDTAPEQVAVILRFFLGGFTCKQYVMFPEDEAGFGIDDQYHMLGCWGCLLNP